MNLSLEDKVVVVTGSSRGIGRSIAEMFLLEGSKVCISGRNSDSLTGVHSELASRFGVERISAYQGDLADGATVAQLAEHVDRTWGGTDIVVSNVGSGRGKPGWDIEEAEWQRLFSLNFWSAVLVSRAFLPALVRSKSGCILFISSIAGLESSPAPLAYSSAKAALLNYCNNLARQVARQGVRVNAIAPGNVFFKGGSWEAHLSQRREEVLDFIQREVPMNRFGSPIDIASLAVYLSSDRSDFITGGCFVVDGGQTRRS